MAVNRDELITSLNELIKTCLDAENGFRTAVEKVQNAELEKFLKNCAVQRSEFATQLGARIRQLDGTAEYSGSLPGTLHRAWINLKSIVSGDDAILAECARGDAAAVAKYQEILKQNLPPNVLPIVKQQYTDIKRTHDRIRDIGSRGVERRGVFHMNVGEKLLYLLAGTGLGAAAGLLFAPRSGVEMRERLSSSVSDTMGNISSRISETDTGQASNVRNVAERGKNIASIAKQRVSENVETGKERLNESIESGRSEYR